MMRPLWLGQDAVERWFTENEIQNMVEFANQMTV